jgi:16S rRNA processing protein RimM
VPAEGRLITAGRVGRAHGLDGSFHVAAPEHLLEEGTTVTVRGTVREVRRSSGTSRRPIVRLEGIGDRDSAEELRGELLLVHEAPAPLDAGEWLADDLVGLRVEGLGRVTRVMAGPSCDLLETEDGTLVPLVSDAVRHVDLESGTVAVDLRFLGLER